MSAYIGSVRGPHHNSPDTSVVVHASPQGAEVIVFATPEAARRFESGKTVEADAVMRVLDPIAARNLAALLVRASEETERMRDRARVEQLVAESRARVAALAPSKL